MTERGSQGILFEEDPAQKVAELRAKGVFVCEMPAGIASLTALHEALSRGLLFPDHYGANWDALDEMLSDLAWLPAREVAIVHRDVPRLEQADLALYFQVVTGAGKEAGARALICVLPTEARWARELLNAHGEGQSTAN